jgi:hypothetical protein
MARVKGGLFTGMLDVNKRFPLDSRMLVSKREDLINPTVWKTNTLNTEATYNVMIVSVNSDGEHNGVYYLIDRKAITEKNYSAYKAALAANKDTSPYFFMWMKLSTLADIAVIESRLQELRGYIDEQVESIDLSHIALRRDNDYNYKKIENTFIPENGEVCFVDVAGYGLRTKVGDGISTFAQLPYADETILQNINSLIVKGYFYQGNFYYDAAHTTLLGGMVGRIYIDAVSSKIYTYNGGGYETPNGSLPNATAELAGVVKLYDQVGQNTDGTMTQRAITNELNEKFEMDVIKEEEMVIFDINID